MSMWYNSTTDCSTFGCHDWVFRHRKKPNWIRIPSPGTGVWEMSADVAMGILSRCGSKVWRTCHRHHHIIPSPYYETLPKWSRLCGDSLLNHMVSLNGGVERMNGGMGLLTNLESCEAVSNISSRPVQTTCANQSISALAEAMTSNRLDSSETWVTPKPIGESYIRT